MENENIVQLVTSYTQNGLCNLLFPVVDYDLYDLLLQPEQPKWITVGPQVMDSFRDLATGLHYLHNFRPLAKSEEEIERITKHGYYHDIKPSNILVKGARLILADFGLSRVKTVDEDTKTPWKNTLPTYAVPEACDPVTLEERHIGRAYDICSFGCVLSEFAIYALRGAAAVKTYRHERELEGIYGKHNCFHHDGEVNPAVIAWHREMENNYRSSSQSMQFGLSSMCFVVDPEKRLKSQDIVREPDLRSVGRWKQSVTMAISQDWEDLTGASTVYLIRLALEKKSPARVRLCGWSRVI